MVLMNRVAIDGRTRLIGLIGWPIGPYSPVELYNAAFHASGLNWSCVPLTVVKGQLRAALQGLRALGFVGAEVTEPYQRDVVAHVDELSPAAETTGVVDFVRVDDCGRLVGDNVRWLGFLVTLRTLVPSLNGLRPLVIGAGTGARSIVYALTHEGLPLTIVDERIDQAIDLVHRLRHVLHEHSFSVYRLPQDLDRIAFDANLIINASVLELWPDANPSPWPDHLPFPEDALVFDLVPWHTDTCFLRQARMSGATTMNGLPLLVNAAAAAFERWTGQPAVIEAMRQAVVEGGMWEMSQNTPWPRDMAFAN
jgi:shikimate dehydrogenase